MKKLFIGLALLFLTSGCALGPLLSHDTGRTVGQGYNDFKISVTNTGYFAIKYMIGIADDVDLGVEMEALGMGFRGKYSFINEDKGLAMAAIGGIGTTIGGSYYYVHWANSYRTGKWEPFGGIRVTNVKWDATQTFTDSGDIFATVPGGSFTYGSVFLGGRYNFSDRFALGLELSTLVAFDDSLQFNNTVLPSLGFGFEF